MSSRPAHRPHLANSPFNKARMAAQAVGEPIPVGSRVSHDRHGVGTVVALDGEASVIVDFGGGELRRVALNSSRLERL
ncbi:hypothetical protein [Georgenia sp. AZ-5]|uniref:hypothetical protein n=1 Tax=Georgenia sp. AZ-5 TaxID=3367526 RepID=UPI0037550B39